MSFGFESASGASETATMAVPIKLSPKKQPTCPEADGTILRETEISARHTNRQRRTIAGVES